MTQKQVIDVHCHLFNAQYAVMELAAATWSHLRGHYPHQKGATDIKAVRGFGDKLDGIKEFAKWIAGLLDVTLSDCEGNFGTSLKNFAQSGLGTNASLGMAPLMMDIYFALSDNKDEETAGRRERPAAPKVAAFAIPENQKKDFDAHFDMIRKLILANISKKPKKGRGLSSDRAIDAIFDGAKKELLAAPRRLRKGIDPYEGIELSPGYRKHLQDLEALTMKYPGQVHPFLAVDPRRIGIMKLIGMKINKGKGIFRGVKIYPPLGYLPTHPNLEPVFDYCEKFDIPITLHCSPCGMQNFRGKNYVRSWIGDNHWEDFRSLSGNKSRYYTAPEKWLPVLTRFPNLRINFAHFGGGDQLALDETDWMNAIIKMIEQHPQVYTDISYHAKKELPAKILEVIGRNEFLNEKLMFGTDYIMMMMDPKLGGLAKYFDLYSSFPDNLLYDNARRFLKL